jgi:hypothetical protein
MGTITQLKTPLTQREVMIEVYVPVLLKVLLNRNNQTWEVQDAEIECFPEDVEGFIDCDYHDIINETLEEEG